jgi:hypothetical protein
MMATEAEKELIEACLSERTYSRVRNSDDSRMMAAVRAVRKERLESLESGWRERAAVLLRAHLRASREWNELSDRIASTMSNDEFKLFIDELYPKDA